MRVLVAVATGVGVLLAEVAVGLGGMVDVPVGIGVLVAAGVGVTASVSSWVVGPVTVATPAVATTRGVAVGVALEDGVVWQPDSPNVRTANTAIARPMPPVPSRSPGEQLSRACCRERSRPVRHPRNQERS